MYIYYQNKLKEAIAVYSSQSVIITASVSNHVKQSIKATEIQKNVQQYTSWLFSNADATKNPKNTAITLTNDENHFCSICGAICNSIDVFCSNCGNKIN